jgi:hypothetical protein
VFHLCVVHIRLSEKSLIVRHILDREPYGGKILCFQRDFGPYLIFKTESKLYKDADDLPHYVMKIQPKRYFKHSLLSSADPKLVVSYLRYLWM